VGSVDLERICKTVARFYQFRVRRHTGYPFTAEDVRTHLLEHTVDVRAVLADTIRKLNEYDKDFAATARQFDDSGALLPPDPASTKAHREVLKDRVSYAQMFEKLVRKK
jgi:hypothetical protein